MLLHDININTFDSPNGMAVANGYFNFSASGFLCQVRLPRFAVASQKGNSLISVMVFVDKICAFYV